MKFVPYEANHLLSLSLQTGQEYCGNHIDAGYAGALEFTSAITALVDEQPVAVAGLCELWSNRALLWSFLDHRAGPHMVTLHRAALRVLEAAPYRRIEAETACDFEPGHRWLRMLGFEMEAPRMRAFRVDGGDSALYARVKHG